MGWLWQRIRKALYRRMLNRHSERWSSLGDALGSPLKFRLMLYLNANNPATKDDMINYLMETGQVKRRDSAVRMANRFIAEFARRKLAEVGPDGTVRLKRKIPVIVGEPPGLWITSGLGIAIVLIGLARSSNNLPLLVSAIILLAYSSGVIAHFLLKFSPY